MTDFAYSLGCRQRPGATVSQSFASYFTSAQCRSFSFGLWRKHSDHTRVVKKKKENEIKKIIGPIMTTSLEGSVACVHASANDIPPFGASASVHSYSANQQSTFFVRHY